MDTADTLAQRIKHHLILHAGRSIEEATSEDLYAALVHSLREEIMVSWVATHQTLEHTKERILYYLSMEYLPGRLLSNMVINLLAMDTVQGALAKLNRNLHDIISCEPDPGLGNGGLGRLASCFLDSLATHHYPARAYGLRYQYGTFEQEIWNGVQVERPDCWLLRRNPWEWRRDSFANLVHFGGTPVPAQNRHGDDVYLLENPEEVRSLPQDLPVLGFPHNGAPSVLTLRLWSTKESPRNFQLQRYNMGRLDQAAENTTLTDVLYPSDSTGVGKRIRLKQQFLLVSSSLKDIIRRHLRIHGDLSNLADKVRIQINDTHPSLVIAELMRTLTKNYNFAWKDAWEATCTICSYTNHTVLREALEEWSVELLQEQLPRQLNIIERLNLDFCNEVRAKYPGDEEKVRRLSIIEEGRVRMSHLAIVGSHKINGVAALHTQILKERVFPDFAQGWPDKFASITNGVTHRRWLFSANPHLSLVIHERIGSEWLFDPAQLSRFADSAKDPHTQQLMLNVKRLYKERLSTYFTQEARLRDCMGHICGHPPAFPLEAIVDVQIKRFHEYKRQLLHALHLMHLYNEHKKGTNRHPRLAVIAGKCAPSYVRAKEILLLLSAIARKVNSDRALEGKLRIAILENYSVSLAELIIPAADLSEQISTAGWEASGTGNMKLSLNGALTIGTEDGANVEMRQAVTDSWWPFRFGHTAEENLRDSPHAGAIGWSLYTENPTLNALLNSLKDGTYSETPEEAAAFSRIYDSLVQRDTFFVLRDFPSYARAQLRAEALYRDSGRWAEHAIHNIAAMGNFSSDRAIAQYASDIWHLRPMPLDPAILAQTRELFQSHDRCFIPLK